MRLEAKTDEKKITPYNNISCLKVKTIQRFSLYRPKYELSFYNHETNKNEFLIAYAYRTEGV